MVNSERRPITFSEWKAYVAQDDTIEHDQSNGETDFLFIAHPIEPIPLWWDEGRIEAKYPDGSMRKKMYSIARYFNGRVLGDNDEEYDEDGCKLQVDGEKKHNQKNRLRTYYNHLRCGDYYFDPDDKSDD